MMNYLNNSNIFANFGAWIGRSCKPSDKGKLTALPHFQFCQHNFKNVSNMLKYEDLPEINSKRWLSLENLEGEDWRDVEGFEEHLQISSYGRLKRKRSVIERSNEHGFYTIREKILALQPDYRGYVFKPISIEGVRSNLNIHRLVAKAFVANPKGYPDVNHIDENHSDNIYTNLEWCTRKYNSNYGTIKERIKKTRIDRGRTRKIVLYTYNGEPIKEYDTLDDAGRDLGVNSVMIGRCCEGKVSCADGFHFRYKGVPYVKRKILVNRYFCETTLSDGTRIKDRNVHRLCCKLGISYASFMNVLKGTTKQMTPPYQGTINIVDSYGNSMKIANGILIK